MRHLIPLFIHNKYKAAQYEGHFDATTLFVDISGFTQLTEALTQHGTEGAEALSMILDGLFEPLVALVAARRGIIPHFAGDAFTAIFEGAQAEEILALATEIHHFFKEKAIWPTRFGDFHINFRLGISYGRVDWGIIGHTPKAFYFRGAAIDQAAAAEHQAQKGDIVFDTALMAILPPQQAPIVPLKPGFFKLNIDPQSASVFPTAPPSVGGLESGVLADFLPNSILKFNEKGEFREVVSIFICFEGIESHAELEAFTTTVVSQFKAFGGYFKELDFGDKGGLMVGFFGAPVAFENNLVRGLEFCLALDDLLHTTHNRLRYKMGMTHGTAYAGLIGGKERVQYAVVGNKVNIAARLAMYADWGETLVDDRFIGVPQFVFQEKGAIQYKGVSAKVPTHQLLQKRNLENPIFLGDMIGRYTELATLSAWANAAFAQGRLHIGVVHGEAGVGKSRLAHELQQDLAQTHDLIWAVCQADQILRKPFNPFIYYLKVYFSQISQHSAADNEKAFEQGFEALLAALPPTAETERTELERTKDVLAALVGLVYPDSLWTQLDARGRYDNTLVAFTHFFAALAQTRPLVLALEDVHWLDEDSRYFLILLIKKAQHLPLFFLMTSRYDDEGHRIGLFAEEILRGGLVSVGHIDLNVLQPDSLRNFAQNRLKGPIDAHLVDMLWRTTNGNPFYAEQILDYLKENNLLLLKNGLWNVADTSIKISNSITAVLTARIDRLSTVLKETVKAAAVIGREFDVTILSEVMLKHEEYLRQNGEAPIVLQQQIETAEKGQIWHAMNELRYIFRHALLREAVYDMQLKTRLRELHFMVAEAIEKVYADNIEERYLDLAFHFEQAEKTEKTVLYLQKAAEYARRNFQNQQALECYDRLLKYQNTVADTVKTAVRKGSLLQLIGRWAEADACFQMALQEAQSVGEAVLLGHAHNAYGNLLILKGLYTEAQPHLKAAAQHFEAVRAAKGLSKTFGNLGNLYFRQGAYEEAKAYYLRSISLSREHGLRSAAAIVSNLGLTYMNQGHYTEGVASQEEELQICTALNDVVGMATVLVNLGIVWFEKGNTEEALSCFERGLELSHRLGNKQLTSIALGCAGNVYRLKGDLVKAEQYLEADLKMCQELGDPQGIAIVYELLGLMHLSKDAFATAHHYFTDSLGLCRQLNYQKGVAKALQGLSIVAMEQGESQTALSHIEEALTIGRNINNRLIAGQCLVQKSHILRHIGDAQQAEHLNAEAARIAQALGNGYLLAQIEKNTL